MQRDSVEVTLQARITANATAFEAWVGVAGEDLLQGVRPYGQNAATVFVPSVAAGGALIRRVEVPPLVSPNGDGVNDEGAIRFVLAKIEDPAPPEVSIYDLSGLRVRLVEPGVDGYGWDGRDDAGELLPPGVYVCQIKLFSDIGDQLVRRIVNLAY